jgi:hypothetical protein
MPACVHGWSPLGACPICTPPGSRSSAVTFASPEEIAGRLQIGDLLIDAAGHPLRVHSHAGPRHVGHERFDLSGQYNLELFGTEIEYTTGWDETADVEWPLRRARVFVGDDEVTVR